jgi:hypothetical protein
MKGVVIAQGNGNLAGQFRVFQKKLAGAAVESKAYGLDSAILDLLPKVKSNFVKPKPSPLIHSKLISLFEKDDNGVSTSMLTGEKVLLCFDPIIMEQMEAEYSMDLKIKKSNWNQFELQYEGFYQIPFDNIDDTIITYYRADKRMASIESNKDLVGFLLILRSVCAQNHGAIKVDQEYHNLSTLHSAIAYRQKKNTNDTKFADEVADRYDSVLFTSGQFAIYGVSPYENVLKTYPSTTGSPLTFIEYLQLLDDDRIPIDTLVKERTVARLIVKNSLNDRLRKHLITSFSTGDDCYSNTINDALSLLSTFIKTKKDTTSEDAVVSYHDTTEEDDIIDDDDTILDDPDIIDDDVADDTNDDIEMKEEESHDNIKDNHATFNATVMASVISEATADACR